MLRWMGLILVDRPRSKHGVSRGIWDGDEDTKIERYGGCCFCVGNEGE